MTSEFVDVWLGRFESEAALAAYLEETYSEDDEAAPISRFAADQGQRSYDHDFVESDFFAETADLAAALDGFSYARAYLADVVAAYRAQAAPPVNVALLAFDNAIRAPKSASSATYWLIHLGRFRFGPEA